MRTPSLVLLFHSFYIKFLVTKNKKMRTKETIGLFRVVSICAAFFVAGGAQAATVQITFANSVISKSAGIQGLVRDLGSDGVNDLRGISTVLGVELWEGEGDLGFKAAARFNGGSAEVDLGGTGMYGTAALLHRAIWFTVVDQNIMSGVPTTGWLDVWAYAGEDDQVIDINRFVFDDVDSGVPPTGFTVYEGAYPEYNISAVPEPGTNLAMLAVVAGGLALRRRTRVETV